MDGLFAFAGVAALIIVTPGPDLVLVTRSILAGGRRAGLLTALGIATGSATWALGAAVGIAALLDASPALLGVIRWVGAGYLAWVGLGALLARDAGTLTGDGNAEPAHRTSTNPFRIGMISNLLHPGQIVFYTSMLPQFIDPARDATPQALVLGAIFAVLALTWFTTYAILAAGLRLWAWERFAPALTRVTGVVLVGLAVRLALRP
ncbi:MAG: LysE family translocator [Candidatus Limnocylindrales bacterium]